MDDSFLKQEVIGKTFDEKLNNSIADYFTKRKFTELGYVPRPGAIGVVHTLEDGMVKAIGGSEPHDIINDNFGKWLGAFWAVPSTAFSDGRVAVGQGNQPVPISGSPLPGGTQTVYGSQNGGNSWSGQGGLSRMQIGQGVTAPTVSDFDVETPFVGGAESLRTLLIGTSAYAPSIARVASACSIGPTLGGGTITELCLFTDMSTRFPTNFTFLFSHDAIAPSVPFVGGETIFAQYFWQL